MQKSDGVKCADAALLAARILIALLFLIFGWSKLFGYSGTVQYMAHVGAPLPALAALVAIVMEVFVGIAIVLGLATRPLALLLAVYTFGAALIGHHFWSMSGMDRYMNEINFYKNVSIIGGLLALYVAGAGRYSFDSWWCGRKSGAPAGG